MQCFSQAWRFAQAEIGKHKGIRRRPINRRLDNWTSKYGLKFCVHASLETRKSLQICYTGGGCSKDTGC